jgi:para-nitrobenzyl esterase
LNVYAPINASALPVLVWLHGGSFLIGTANADVYDGEVLATQANAVVVTANYRLGAFGFLASDDQDSNLGLMLYLLLV